MKTSAMTEAQKDQSFYIKELLSNECQCGRRKKSRHSLCWPCFKRLPWSMQQDLYLGIGEGYEEAYDAALKWLND